MRSRLRHCAPVSAAASLSSLKRSKKGLAGCQAPLSAGWASPKRASEPLREIPPRAEVSGHGAEWSRCGGPRGRDRAERCSGLRHATPPRLHLGDAACGSLSTPAYSGRTEVAPRLAHPACGRGLRVRTQVGRNPVSHRLLEDGPEAPRFATDFRGPEPARRSRFGPTHSAERLRRGS
jgi:hypothetical protein